MFGPIIKDLHGNIFSTKTWGLYIAIPQGKYDKLIFTKDHLSDKPFNLAIKGNKYYAYILTEEQSIYVKYKLTLQGYDESLDIRKAYLYGKRKSK